MDSRGNRSEGCQAEYGLHGTMQSPIDNRKMIETVKVACRVVLWGRS